jgi:predicted permease
VVVLGYGIWQSEFGGDPAIVGGALRVNGETLTVVGIAPRGFAGLGYAAGFFVPLAQSDRVAGVARLQSPEERWVRTLVRLPRGTSTASAAGALSALARTLDESTPLAAGARGALLQPATAFDPESNVDPFFHAARALTAAAVLFLLLSSANVAGLLLARAALREREWALRKALGASPRVLLASLAGEIAWPALLGALGGLLVAKAIALWLERMLLTPLGGIGPGWAPPGQSLLAFDARAVLFALTAALTTCAVALAPPFLRVLRDDPNRALRSGDARAGTRLGARRVLVVLEVALAVVLVVGGVLLARSLGRAASSDLGFDAHGLTLATIHLPRGGARPPAAAWNALLEEVRRLPAVRSATIAHVPPSTGFARATRVAPLATPAAWRDTSYNLVATDYFKTLGVPIVAGRTLDDRDTPQTPAVVVVNRALADALFPGASAVGQRLRVELPPRPGDAGPDFEIVGVVADAATTSPIASNQPSIFFAYGQRSHSRMTLLVRSTAPLGALEPAVRRALGTAAPEAAVIDLVDADEQRTRSLHPLRINATLAEGLAAIAAATALAGLLALQMFSVGLRRREFGVRLALGARHGDLAGLIVRDGLRLGAAGTLVGLAASLATTRFLRTLLYGVGESDPWTLTLVPLVMIAGVLVAGWIPARRAMRTDPAESLRAL